MEKIPSLSEVFKLLDTRELNLQEDENIIFYNNYVDNSKQQTDYKGLLLLSIKYRGTGSDLYYFE